MLFLPPVAKLRFVFAYDTATGHFSPAEDYYAKYAHLKEKEFEN